jgi:hypothetical protein
MTAPILTHHHERYPMGAPAMRAACGEVAYRQEHQVSFDWKEVTCPQCLATKNEEKESPSSARCESSRTPLLSLVDHLVGELSEGKTLHDLAQQVAFEVRQLVVKLENATSRGERSLKDGKMVRKALGQSVVRLRSSCVLLGSEALDIDSEDLGEMVSFIAEMETICNATKHLL